MHIRMSHAKYIGKTIVGKPLKYEIVCIMILIDRKLFVYPVPGIVDTLIAIVNISLRLFVLILWLLSQLLAA